MKYFIVLLLNSLFLLSCTTSSTVYINPDLREDDAYYKALDESTRTSTVYDDFENKFSIEATYLSPEFRQAFSNRLKSLYLQESPSLGEANNKAGFFVTIHSPDDEDMNISDTQLWTILLKSSSEPMSPVLVKRLSKKKRWTPFFNVNKWTNEYLVLFDTPSISISGAEMVKERQLNLTFAHSAAKVEFVW